MREVRRADPLELERQWSEAQGFVDFARDGVRRARQRAVVAPVLEEGEVGVFVPAFPQGQHGRVKDAADEEERP